MSFNIGHGVLQQLTDCNYQMIIIPTGDDPRLVVNCGPSNVFLSGNPNSPTTIDCTPRLIRTLLNCRLPAFNVYVKRRVLKLSLKTSAFGLGFNRQKLGRPYKLSHRMRVADRGRNFTLTTSSVPSRSMTVARFGLGSHAITNLTRGALPVFSIRCRPRTDPNPRSTSCLFSGFIRAVHSCQSRQRPT